MSAGRILVVDDEPQIRRIMRTTLAGAGYEVDDAKTGEETLEKLRDYHPDLILLDMNMPGMGGIEACKRIRTSTIEKRLLDRHGNPNFDVTFYVLDAQGRHAGVSLLSGAKYAVCTENGPETLVCDALIERKPVG